MDIALIINLIPSSAATAAAVTPAGAGRVAESASEKEDNDSDQINNPFNIAAQYARAGYDQTHVFSTDWVYAFPRVTDNRALGVLVNGWELTSILSVHSGMPFSVYSNGNLNGYQAGTQYVDVVGDPTVIVIPP